MGVVEEATAFHAALIAAGWGNRRIALADMHAILCRRLRLGIRAVNDRLKALDSMGLIRLPAVPTGRSRKWVLVLPNNDSQNQGETKP